MSVAGEPGRAAGPMPRVPLPDPRALEILRITTNAAGRLESAPRDAGVVHSVHEQVVNILWHDDRLLTIHGAGRLRAPFAAAIERMPAPGSVQPAMPVSRSGRTLTIGGTRVSWRAATLVPTALSPVHDDPALVSGVLLSGPKGPGAEGLRLARGHEAQERIAEGLRYNEARVFADGARALIGLGEGLTPAGDDLLVGVFAVLARFRPSFLAADPTTLTELEDWARGRTTLVGREFLLHALAGEFSELVIEVMTGDSEDAVRAAAERLAGMGASSGVDTLNGMRLALSSLAA